MACISRYFSLPNDIFLLIMCTEVAEHYRILWSFVRVVHEKESDGVSICNPTSCQNMSAGRFV